MFFNSLEQILAKIEQQPGWEEYRQYRQLLECWRKIINKTTVNHTRPLYIRREVLWVATSSAARAQELSFQRYGLLKKLNAQLSFDLKDIRFSTSEWEKNRSPDQNNKNKNSVIEADKTQNTTINLNFQPRSLNSITLSKSSLKDPDTALAKLATPQDSQAALKNWLELVKQRSHCLPLCSQCKVPTPEAELKRWNLCHHCIAKKWTDEYRSPASFNQD